MMKISRENTGEEKRMMEGGGGEDLIDWKLQAERMPLERRK